VATRLPEVNTETERKAVEAPQPPKLTALVISHNRVDRLRACLASLEGSENRDRIEVLVVDNGSTDGSTEIEAEFPKALLVRLPKNFGLTKALNIGVRASNGEYICLLHEDTEVFPETLRALLAVIEAQPDVGCVCPLLVTPDGQPAPQLGSLPPDYRYEPAEVRGEPYAVPYPRGAMLLVRAYFLKAQGKIDEKYGQFGSDAELSFQIRRAGKKILVLPHVRAIHHGRGANSPMLQADREIGRAVFIGKHMGVFAGFQARVSASFRALGRFEFGELSYLLSGQKVDGNQA
jgi:N-acetylglucosaminyl-diphospho-decaprenol L-rhamnosyltransferase